ncbi:MAG: hypothetical protein HKN52_11495 [Eudoraea sp.]|nr:hypothetical protein [Eudoraea sp.]
MKWKILGLSAALYFLFSPVLSAQLVDLARVDFTILPSGASNFEFSRIRGNFNYPLKLKNEKGYLFLGLDYSNINFVYNQEELSFDSEVITEFQIIDLNIAYVVKLKNDWMLGARFSPGISSNLKLFDSSAEDIVFSGDLVFIKDKKDQSKTNPYRLIVGISYSGNRGFPVPLPFLSYYRKFHSNWSYDLGIPKTNLQYHFSEKNRLKLYAQLDGFTANINGGTPVDQDIAQSINMSLILAGIQYECHFKDHFEFYLRTSYILSRDVQLRDSKKDDIFLIDDSNGGYISTGLRIKI